MKYFCIANFLIASTVLSLVLGLSKIDSTMFVVNNIILFLSILIPSLYLIGLKIIKIQKNDNETLAPSIVITLLLMAFDVVFYSILVGTHSANIKLSLITFGVVHAFYVALILVIRSLTTYIRKQH